MLWCKMICIVRPCEMYVVAQVPCLSEVCDEAWTKIHYLGCREREWQRQRFYCKGKRRGFDSDGIPIRWEISLQWRPKCWWYGPRDDGWRGEKLCTASSGRRKNNTIISILSSYLSTIPSRSPMRRAAMQRQIEWGGILHCTDRKSGRKYGRCFACQAGMKEGKWLAENWRYRPSIASTRSSMQFSHKAFCFSMQLPKMASVEGRRVFTQSRAYAVLQTAMWLLQTLFWHLSKHQHLVNQWKGVVAIKCKSCRCPFSLCTLFWLFSNVFRTFPLHAGCLSLFSSCACAACAFTTLADPRKILVSFKHHLWLYKRSLAGIWGWDYQIQLSHSN